MQTRARTLLSMSWIMGLTMRMTCFRIAVVSVGHIVLSSRLIIIHCARGACVDAACVWAGGAACARQQRPRRPRGVTAAAAAATALP
jgi:hypothetical protein